MKPYILGGLAVLALALFAGPVLGQAGAPVPPPPAAQPNTPLPPPPGPPQAGPHDRHGNDEMRDEDIRELVSTILMVRLTRSLELNDEQTIVMVRHIQDLRDALTQVGHDRDEVMKSLRELTAKEGVSDADIEAKLKELVALDDKRMELRRTAFEKAGAGLTPKQRAKLYLTFQDFEGQMRRLISRAKEMGSDKLMRFREDMERPHGDFREGNGPPPPGMDNRPILKQMMKNRKLGPPPGEGEMPPPPPPPAEKKAE